jgi:hypothetical protein
MKFFQLADIDDSILSDTHTSDSTDAYLLYHVDEHSL